MSSGLSQVALQSYVSCLAFVEMFRRQVYQSLVVALALSRVDYGSATLAGLPACLLTHQSVLNAAARSIAGLRRSEHIADALASFH